MTGVLTKTASGLIYADTCESYPNGWSFAKTPTGLGGYGGLITPSHSGSYGMYVREDPNGNNWAQGYGSYVKLTKDVSVSSGASRLCRLFRGLPQGDRQCIAYDEFPGTSLDTNKWEVQDPPVTVSGGQMHVGTLGNHGKVKSKNFGIYKPNCVAARFAPHNVDRWWAIHQDDSNYCKFEFGVDTAGILKVMCAKGGTETRVTVGSFSTEMANYMVRWTEGNVIFYKNGSELAEITTNIPDGPADKSTFEGGDVVQSIDVEWVSYSTVPPASYKASFKIGSQTIFDKDVGYGAEGESEKIPDSNGYFTHGWASVTPTGVQTLEYKLRMANTHAGEWEPWNMILPIDDIVIMSDDSLIIKGLAGGQKVELYDSGGTLRRSGVCAGGGISVELRVDDLFSTALGFQGYMKVYDTDGITLLYTTSTVYHFGGDEWTWIPNTTKCEASANVTLVYRTGSGLSPTQAVVTVTLTDAGTGSPLNGKTINWSANGGSVNPSSGPTNSNGQASTTFTAGTLPGLGGVKGQFNGDATYGPSAALQLIDIYYDEVTPDADEDFQVFVVGQEIAYSAGNYRLDMDFRPQSFSVTTPDMSVTLGGWWAVEIYRRGTMEFKGRIMALKYKGGANPFITFSGVDETILLQRRVANRTYTDEPKLIIEDLLIRYPTGVTAGTISLYGSSIKLEATYDNVYDALAQIARTTGWKFRRNSDNSLDFGPDFGVETVISIEKGQRETDIERNIDFSQMDTKVYVIGKTSSLVSVKEDLDQQAVYGLIEEPFLEKGISEQGSLDTAAQAILNERKEPRETIPLDWIDQVGTAEYGPFDWVTVIDAEIGINGLYQVASLTRALTNADHAALELGNRALRLADLIQPTRKDVKDLGVI